MVVSILSLNFLLLVVGSMDTSISNDKVDDYPNFENNLLMGEAFSFLFVLSFVFAKTPRSKISKICSELRDDCERVHKYQQIKNERFITKE